MTETQSNPAQSSAAQPWAARWLFKAELEIRRRLQFTVECLRGERGDVPGWVLVTLMTAGLVVLLWGLAGPALKGIFDQALNKVSQF